VRKPSGEKESVYMGTNDGWCPLTKHQGKGKDEKDKAQKEEPPRLDGSKNGTKKGLVGKKTCTGYFPKQGKGWRFMGKGLWGGETTQTLN